MKRAATAIALVLPLFAASGASATDLLGGTGDPHIDQQLREKIRWSGFYGGIAGTIGMTNTEMDADGIKLSGFLDGMTNTELGASDGTSSGFLGFLDGIGAEGFGATGTVGYDQRLGSFIIGGFFDFTYSDDLWDTEFGFSEGVNGFSGEINREYDWTAGIRVGKLINPDTMVYALAGYSQLEVSAVWKKAAREVGGESVGSNLTFDGYTVGAGIESKINDFASWYVEGRWSEYDSEVVYRKSDDPGALVIEAEPSEVKAMAGFKLRLLTE